MSVKSVKLIVSNDLVPTVSDKLPGDCLRIETTSKLIIKPNTDNKINLTIHNTSGIGRIAHIKANYDERFVRVHLTDAHIYVAPDGKTATQALIVPLVPGGQSLVRFDVH